MPAFSGFTDSSLVLAWSMPYHARMAQQVIPQWTLADRLAKALDEAGISVQEMADILMVSRNTVGNYINGRSVPKPAYMRVWAERCQVPLSWLETGDGSSDLPGAPKRWTVSYAA